MEIKSDDLSNGELQHIVDMICSGYFYDTFWGDNGEEIEFFLTISKKEKGVGFE